MLMMAKKFLQYAVEGLEWRSSGFKVCGVQGLGCFESCTSISKIFKVFKAMQGFYPSAVRLGLGARDFMLAFCYLSIPSIQCIR